MEEDLLDISSEPVVDIPIKADTTIDLSALQNEAEALEIEPFIETQPDFYTEQPTDFPQDCDTSGSPSLGQRIGAGLMAPIMALDPSGTALESINEVRLPTDVPAIVQECEPPPSLDDVLAEYGAEATIYGTNEKNNAKFGEKLRGAIAVGAATIAATFGGIAPPSSVEYPDAHPSIPIAQDIGDIIREGDPVEEIEYTQMPDIQNDDDGD